MRTARVDRKTNETAISVEINLDGKGQSDIKTGIGFLDHMIEQLSRHSLMDITVKATGDLHIDMHHTTEDTGICLGQAVAKALGERRGVRRYGHSYLAMDEALSRVAVDISGRPFLVWRVAFGSSKIGEMDTELFQEFFHAFAQHSKITLHVESLYGSNNHHIVESCFKALAQALRHSMSVDSRMPDAVPSTKGTLDG